MILCIISIPFGLGGATNTAKADNDVTHSFDGVCRTAPAPPDLSIIWRKYLSIFPPSHTVPLPTYPTPPFKAPPCLSPIQYFLQAIKHVSENMEGEGGLVKTYQAFSLYNRECNCTGNSE